MRNITRKSGLSVLPVSLLLLIVVSGCTFFVPENRVEDINPAWLPSPDTVQAWHERKAKGIHTFTGSPSWYDYMSVVEAGLDEAGVADVIRDKFTYKRWYTSDNPDDGRWSLTIDGQSLPVASYWAYSGSTSEEGVTAPLLMYGRGTTTEDMKGKIVVFQVPAVEEPLPKMFQAAGYEYASNENTLGGNDVFAANQWFQTNYVTRFGRFEAKMRRGEAAGALVIFSMGPERAAGLYTFPLLEPGTIGSPGLYVDRNVGEVVKSAAENGMDATLRLIAEEEEVTGHFYTAFLPGRDYGTEDDEYVFLITHSDGPNLTQENGAFALLSIVQYFGRIPQEDRPRTLAIMMDPQHFTPHRHRDDWYEMHPEIVERIVATIGVEHLGQREYTEEGDRLVETGQPETTFVFAQDNDNLINGAIAGVRAFRVPRTMVQSPPRGGQGNWAGMSDVAIKRNYPGYGISTNMSAYWSTRAGIQTFDRDLFVKQVGLATHLTGVLMSLSSSELKLPDSK